MRLVCPDRKICRRLNSSFVLVLPGISSWLEARERLRMPLHTLQSSYRMSRVLQGVPQFLLRHSAGRATRVIGASALPMACGYATQDSTGTNRGSTRKQITVASDDGRVRWGELSAREKAARTTQQTFNFVTVLVGLVMTVSGTSI
jgi:hypothetical protein